jgi:hypothetical protein
VSSTFRAKDVLRVKTRARDSIGGRFPFQFCETVKTGR